MKVAKQKKYRTFKAKIMNNWAKQQSMWSVWTQSCTIHLKYENVVYIKSWNTGVKGNERERPLCSTGNKLQGLSLMVVSSKI